MPRRQPTVILEVVAEEPRGREVQRRALFRAPGAADPGATAAVAEEARAGARANRKLERPALAPRREPRDDAGLHLRAAVRARREDAASPSVRTAPGRGERGRARDGEAAMPRVAQRGAWDVEADRP